MPALTGLVQVLQFLPEDRVAAQFHGVVAMLPELHLRRPAPSSAAISRGYFPWQGSGLSSKHQTVEKSLSIAQIESPI